MSCAVTSAAVGLADGEACQAVEARAVLPADRDRSLATIDRRIVREREGRDHPMAYNVVSASEFPVIGQAVFYGH
jgi:hypothetical protein